MTDALGPRSLRGADLSGYLFAQRYRLDRLLANGGMAQVWAAEDTVLNRSVAVKLLHSHLSDDDMFVRRFRNEAVAAARLSHRSIVSIYDTCTDSGRVAIVMELVRGQTLRQLLDESGPLDPTHAVALVAEIAEALDAAHRGGIVHRDIKPANILLCDDGRVMVADFGIAKAREDTDLTREGTMIGTAKYLAPEQVLAQRVDGRADLYSLGIMLYEAVCGRVPFHADTDAATALARLHGDPRPPSELRPELPPDLNAAIMRVLARDPADRYSDAAEFGAALLAADLTPRMPVRKNDAVYFEDATTVSPEVWSGAGFSERGQFVEDAAPPVGIVTEPAAGDESPDRPGPGGANLAVAALIIVSLGIAGMIFGQTSLGRNLINPSDSAPATVPAGLEALSPVGFRDFDPLGSDGEHPERVELLFDGRVSTTWITQNYTRPDMAGKDGVGILIDAPPRTVEQLHIASTVAGFEARVHVFDNPSPVGDPSVWPQPVATIARAGSEETVTVQAPANSTLLLWISELGDPIPAGGFVAEIAELTLLG